MQSLVIVESPAKAKTIRKYLGSGFEVKASMGHVRDLYSSKLSVDVRHDFEPDYTVIKGKEKLLQELREAAAKSDFVYLATDPDREGEAISWHLATLLGLDLNALNRVKFNEINKKSVVAGINNPSRIDLDLVNAQQARRILDRLVGYKLSPFISQKIHRGLSAGRVQSVALRLIVDREEEIAKFVPEEYWTLEAVLSAPPSKRQFRAVFAGDETGKLELKNRADTDRVLARLENAVYRVENVKKGVRKRQPSPPFITSTLQQEASRRLGFTAKRTMRIAQELYEGVEIADVGSVGLITYMRTDSLRISEESRADGNAYISAVYGDKYLPDKPRYFKTKAGAQDGHEAIRPTTVELTPERVKASLTAEQFRLYQLIWRRFIASLMANCQHDTVKAEICARQPADESRYILFTASGYTVRFDGYTALYDNADEEEGRTDLPELAAGQALRLRDLKDEQHYTQPPMRYTEASLIKMLEETGVGRPSTYASILSTIMDREYVVRESKKTLKPTELGVAITHLLKEKFPKIVNTRFTAGMESDLDKIEAGGYDYVKMLHTFYDEFEDTLKKAKASMEGVKIKLEEDQTDVPCEKCGAMMVVKVSRYGKFLACPNYPTCKNTKPFVTPTVGKCPRCGGDVISKKTKRGRVFYGCSNYPGCNFMTWDAPTEQACPRCGKTLFRSGRGKLKCLNEDCGYSSEEEKKED